MDQIWDNFLSPVWWLTVVLGGIAVHIIARRIDDHVPKVFGWFAEARRQRSYASRKRSDHRIELIQSDDRMLIYFSATLNRYQLTAISTGFAALGLPLFPSLSPVPTAASGIYMLFAGLCAWLCFLYTRRFYELSYDLEEAVGPLMRAKPAAAEPGPNPSRAP